MGISFKIFLYGFLGMVASILIYNLVKLFRGLKPVEYQTEKLLPQQMEINTNGEVSDDKIKLIEKIVTEVKEDKLRQALLKEIIEGKSAEKEKPRGFWKRWWDNVEPYHPSKRSHFGVSSHFGMSLNDEFSLGLLPSNIHTMAGFHK